MVGWKRGMKWVEGKLDENWLSWLFDKNEKDKEKENKMKNYYNLIHFFITFKARRKLKSI